MARKQWTFSIRLGVVSIFIIATALTAAVAIGLQYYFNYQQALQTAKTRYQASAEQTASHLEQLDRRAGDLTRSLARQPHLLDNNGRLAPSTLRHFADTLALNPQFHALYVGRDNGDFHELIHLQSTADRRHLQAKDNEQWVEIRVQGQGRPRQRQVRYLDGKLRLLRSHRETTAYDPRNRPWYRSASGGGLIKTAPYLFSNTGTPGRTYALRLTGQKAVLGLDLTLSSVTDYLRDLPVADGTELYLYDDNGALLASNAPARSDALPRGLPTLPLSDSEQVLVAQQSPLTVSNETDWAPVDFAISGQPSGYAIDMLRVVSAMTGLQLKFINGHSWPELVELFQAGKIDVLQPILHNQDNEKLGSYSVAFIRLPFGLASIARDTPPTTLSQLDGKTLAVGQGWSIIPVIRQQYPAITLREYPSTLAGMQAVTRGQADAVIDNAIVLRFNQRRFFLNQLHISEQAPGLPEDLGTLHLMVHADQPQLLALLNRALASIPDKVREQLRRKWLTDGQAISQYTGTVPYAQLLHPASENRARLRQFTDNSALHYLYARRLGAHSAMNFAAVASRQVITGAATHHALLAAGITGLCILFLLPFAGLFASPIVHPIKQLEAESQKVKERRYQQITRVRTRIVETEKLAASLYDMARSIRSHERKQQDLMEAFIELIARAIDEKSAYTGAHCARVPALGIMLAEAASSSDDGPFADFSLSDERKRREFRIAAWLHDCGKITTPEHIVDKGAKLEAIYNRIHEIRTRFEVLWRDAEIDYLNASHDAPQQEAQLRQQWQARQQALQQQFAFIAAANQGGETMSEDDKARIREIGAQTWTRHFDDRLGLSPQQTRQLDDREVPLPVMETLLQDKPEHLVPHEHPPQYDDHLGINMAIPRWRANLGEVHNLTIERGTLTSEDRFKINEHIINTIRMLDALPFPEELAKVPQYASTHHERLDGQGYPRRLSAAQLEIPDRILAVADVFEALTAADRPYKHAKTLSESLAIMKQMVADGHIDGEVFALFLRSGVCRRYVRQYLADSQIDIDDIEGYS